MSDILLNTSIAALKAKLLTEIVSATVTEVLQICRAARGAGLQEDTSIETAVNTRVQSLASGATIAEMEQLGHAVKQLLQTTVTGATSTDDLQEGTNNLYYTNSRADARVVLGLPDTDSLTEGSANLYYTDARADARVTAGVAGYISIASLKTEVAASADFAAFKSRIAAL
mgnify:FL=1